MVFSGPPQKKKFGIGYPSIRSFAQKILACGGGFWTLISVGALLWGCAQKSAQETEGLRFQLLDPARSGLDFENKLTPSDSLNILEYLYYYNGGGVAIGDVNGDGLDDIYLMANQGENKLFLNRGGMHFEDITASAGVGLADSWSTGATFVDINGDGLLDLYVCEVGDYKGLKGRNRLFINQGDLTFTEEAEAYGLDFVGFGTHAVFFDYDQDGDLDVYLLNHSIKKPEVFAHADTKFESLDPLGGDRLYRNLHAETGQPLFEDVTAESGIFSSSLGFGLGVAVADVNGDGWPDLYVSNDFTEDDYLYINNQDGTFREARVDKLSQTSRYSMGNDIADLNQDGLPDIFSTDMLPADPEIWMRSVVEDKQEVFEIKERMGYGAQYVRNHLQLNHPDGRFREIALLTETHATDWSWSPLLADFDNDGRVDIFVSNGIYMRPNDLDFIQYSQGQVRAEEAADFQARQMALLPKDKLSNVLFAQRADLAFDQRQEEWGLGEESYSSGAMYADLDNDGDLDLVINNVNQSAFLYENRSRQQAEPGHFVQLQLKGEGLNPFAVGAEVLLALADGSWRHAYQSTSRGFQSGASTRLHFGIGAPQEIKGLYVRWNAAESERFPIPALDSLLVLEKGTGSVEAFPNRFLLEPSPLIRLGQVALDWKHEENDFNDFRREYLIPRRYSQEGPAVAVADVNGDGLEDIFLGGARGQAAKLFLQQPDGGFIAQTIPVFEQMAEAEDVVAVFHDFTGNGAPDLYVGSGGNEHGKTAVFNFDRVFLNDGSGRFTFLPQALPPIAENTATVAVSDVNGDSLPDLFIGVAVETGNFGQAPPAFLLINQGNGTFRDATAQYFGPEFRPGMLQKALWEDLDGDGKPELLLAGEYMAITAYRQSENGQFVRWKELAAPGLYTGMRVQEVEGTRHLLLGNLGLNAKLKASSERPAYLYTGDLDQNGKREAFLMHYKGEALLPFSSRDELITVMPALKRQHPSYAAYAQSKWPDAIFTPEQLARVEELPIRELRSGMLRLGQDAMAFEALPVEAQFSPIQDFFPFQVDGVSYVLALGNFYPFRVDLGRADAQALSLWSWKNGGWRKEPLGLEASRYWGSFRQAVGIKIGGRPHVLLVRNDDKPLFLRLEGTEVLF